VVTANAELEALKLTLEVFMLQQGGNLDDAAKVSKTRVTEAKLASETAQATLLTSLDQLEEAAMATRSAVANYTAIYDMYTQLASVANVDADALVVLSEKRQKLEQAKKNLAAALLGPAVEAAGVGNSDRIRRAVSSDIATLRTAVKAAEATLQRSKSEVDRLVNEALATLDSSSALAISLKRVQGDFVRAAKVVVAASAVEERISAKVEEARQAVVNAGETLMASEEAATANNISASMLLGATQSGSSPFDGSKNDTAYRLAVAALLLVLLALGFLVAHHICFKKNRLDNRVKQAPFPPLSLPIFPTRQGGTAAPQAWNVPQPSEAPSVQVRASPSTESFSQLSSIATMGRSTSTTPKPSSVIPLNHAAVRTSPAFIASKWQRGERTLPPPTLGQKPKHNSLAFCPNSNGGPTYAHKTNIFAGPTTPQFIPRPTMSMVAPTHLPKQQQAQIASF
jgi:hypothetical protein